MPYVADKAARQPQEAILRTPEEIDRRLTMEAAKVAKLQRLLPDGPLLIVARGEKEDGALIEREIAEPKLLSRTRE